MLVFSSKMGGKEKIKKQIRYHVVTASKLKKKKKKDDKSVSKRHKANRKVSQEPNLNDLSNKIKSYWIISQSIK